MGSSRVVLIVYYNRIFRVAVRQRFGRCEGVQEERHSSSTVSRLKMALCTRLLSRSLRLRHVRSVCVSAAKLNESVLPRHELFAKRHIGPSEGDVQEMLKVCGAQASFPSLPP